MKIFHATDRFVLLVAMSLGGPAAFGAGTEIRHVDVATDTDDVRITVELTAPVRPTFRATDQPCRVVFNFPSATLQNPAQFSVYHAGVGEVRAERNEANPSGARISVNMDRLQRFGINSIGNTVVLTILPQPLRPGRTCNKAPVASTAHPAPQPEPRAKTALTALTKIGSLLTSPSVELQSIPIAATIDEQAADSPVTPRRRFRIKFVSGTTAYINGGSNSGLRTGMNLDIRDAKSSETSTEAPIAAARIVGVATTSAILDVGSSSRDVEVGDWAALLPGDANAAHRNVVSGPQNTLHVDPRPVDDNSEPAGRPLGQSFRSTQTVYEDPVPRLAGRIGFDYSGISSSGSTPGTSMQLGMSFQSDIKHILGTHWNLEGYWRDRVTRHSQFMEPTIEDSLNKTYTMQLYYDNPNARWVAGMGRLYLPWAVSLDTVDGGYFGRKLRLGNTTGVFAGSTPDLSSWHYRPNQRIAGAFTNFEGGDYEQFHYSSTAGAGLTSIKWKLDRPFLFFEHELSYKGKLSVYHSLIADAPLGPSTHDLSPGAGISHSYFTLHYQPARVISFDLYHNFFRDVPTALTPIVGTGLVDKLLFQGVSAGTRVRPNRYLTFYTTLGTSEKTGDAHRSLNELFGATWNKIARTGMRADYHYSKFNSNFGTGNYQVLSVSRQMTNRMFWNVQLGKQDMVSSWTRNSSADFLDDSLDINLGRHSYLESGYTYVQGDTMNYRQWYLSWGYRLDQGKRNPQYVQTLLPKN